MTSAATPVAFRATTDFASTTPSSSRVAGTGALPPLSGRLQFARAVLVMLSALSLAAILHLFVVSRLQHSAAQERARDRLRADLALGTAPIGPTDVFGEAVVAGTPIAMLEIPAIGLSEVVAEGTSPEVLFDGPGHRRDTPLPGQIGVSVLFGRTSTYGAPFGRIDALEPGDEITVTTGQGEFEFEVTGVRREGDPVPAPLQPGAARLTLATAGGNLFVPDGVVRVDAEAVTAPVGGAARAVTADTLPGEEQAMANDTRTLWALAMWLQLLIVLSMAAVWAWLRWGRVQTWVVFTPTLLLIGLMAADEASRLLPNLA